ncbi:hypothetical protein ONE63_011540 [Megalurothrips usitatus]|uniref:SET domain-containing protein n=1 Tax=Megalurothrips usitatus TaxID=439358 RepID=A0AAV7X2Y8_9NEOP|nr:hypothetical protein ONE63_011540 [Megalurothrips usitatus]
MKEIAKGSFVLGYKGELIPEKEALKREKSQTGPHSYMYYIRFRNRKLCIDATVESGHLGRLVNHGRSPNLTSKVIEVDKKPRLCFFAAVNISLDEELTINYGDYRPLAIKTFPWLTSDSASEPEGQRPIKGITKICNGMSI